jgi:hypothetical protein
MKADLEELKRIAKADKKRAKLAAQNAEVQKQLAKVKAMLLATRYARLVEENKGVHGWVDSAVFNARYQVGLYGRWIAQTQKLKTPRGQLNRLLVIEGWLDGEER